MRLHITIDTREQRPWHIPDAVATTRIGTIPTGDYALTGDECGFAVERKSLDDFISSVVLDSGRFAAELDRMQAQDFPARVVIVEADFEQCCFRYDDERHEIVPPDHSHYRVTPQFVTRRLRELLYGGVCVMFAGDAVKAAGFGVAVLQERALDLVNRGDLLDWMEVG